MTSNATVTKIEFNSVGFAAIMKSAEMQAELSQRAEAIASAAGDGFEIGLRQRVDRASASIRTATREARKAEAENKALTSALAAGRG